MDYRAVSAVRTNMGTHEAQSTGPDHGVGRWEDL